MTQPTLFILAAGMGSRYGGLKQLDGLGPNGETIMDYSIYDAIRAGFGKVVFVIRHSFADNFRKIVLPKFEDDIKCEVCYQEVESVPEQFSINPERTKPWGTGHALLMAKDLINEPFAVINADDFYGRDSFMVLANFLRQAEGTEGKYCMVGYHVGNTLSESGSVSRGVCQMNQEAYLTDITERTGIEDQGGKIVFREADGKDVMLQPDTLVSMNMWGFTPDYFRHAELRFNQFMEEHGNELKSEFYIPTVVNDLINKKLASVKVLDTTAKWFGVTYAEDRPQVVMKIHKLVQQGIYPEKLFNK